MYIPGLHLIQDLSCLYLKLRVGSNVTLFLCCTQWATSMPLLWGHLPSLFNQKYWWIMGSVGAGSRPLCLPCQCKWAIHSYLWNKHEHLSIDVALSILAAEDTDFTHFPFLPPYSWGSVMIVLGILPVPQSCFPPKRCSESWEPGTGNASSTQTLPSRLTWAGGTIAFWQRPGLFVSISWLKLRKNAVLVLAMDPETLKSP